jgi:hypothetical protein
MCARVHRPSSVGVSGQMGLPVVMERKRTCSPRIASLAAPGRSCSEAQQRRRAIRALGCPAVMSWMATRWLEVSRSLARASAAVGEEVAFGGVGAGPLHGGQTLLASLLRPSRASRSAEVRETGSGCRASARPPEPARRRGREPRPMAIGPEQRRATWHTRLNARPELRLEPLVVGSCEEACVVVGHVEREHGFTAVVLAVARNNERQVCAILALEADGSRS